MYSPIDWLIDWLIDFLFIDLYLVVIVALLQFFVNV